jgi:hypothetical protein
MPRTSEYCLHYGYIPVDVIQYSVTSSYLVFLKPFAISVSPALIHSSRFPSSARNSAEMQSVLKHPPYSCVVGL